MTIYGRSEQLVSRCIECDLAEPESLTSLGGSAPGVVDGILSVVPEAQDPVQVPVVHPQQDAQSSDAPAVITPSRLIQFPPEMVEN